MIRVYLLAALAAVSLTVAGCNLSAKSSETADTSADAAKAAAVDAAVSTAGPYFEKEHEGRLWVFGKEETVAKFEKNGDIPYKLTLISRGPAGETVIIEVDKDDPTLQTRLRARFFAQHGLVDD